MPVIHSSVFLVMKEFPEHKTAIQGLAKSDEKFLTLCDDYRICKEALAYWNSSESDQAHFRVREYQSLLEELEAEILRNLNDY
jgi:hypothetical protein